MKILAIEKEVPGCDWANEKEALVEEARVVYKLQQAGVIREIYFDENKNAVLILESESKSRAMEVLGMLPLVKKGLITFSVMELHPYSGLDRILIG